ncbi:hypothetical protein AC812_12205 [Bellilinea caldifistulae]|uniref:Uncharacterized protein n=1 Tax=Bellilinea caldifistulae TaxID=360411 RepID=A0A0P6XHZ1_9CHLR|nr:hypothetical protein AC812_12205 [Bellilinea caldifistulae]
MQAGEVLVAFVSCAFTSGTFSASASGWTLVRQRQHSNNQQGLAVLVRIAQVGEPSSHTFNINVTGSSRRGIMVRLSGADSTTPIDGTPSDNIGTGTTVTATGITTTHNNSLVMMAANWSANSVNFTPSGMTTTLAINRLAGAHVLQSTAGATGNKTAAIDNSTWIGILFAVSEQQAPPNLPPDVSLITPDQAQLSSPVQLDFAGTDPDNDSITYQVEIADNALFQSGTVVTSEQPSGAGTTIHPNPVAITTWEGYWQVDDRLGMGFQAAGGILDSVDFRFGPHETTPELTNGYYLARVYEAAGYPVNPVPPVWSPSTAYTVGQIVRPTSTANADLHFVYRCKIAGTSAASEPAWPGNGVAWKTVPSGTEVTDGTVTWEALPGLYPVGAADAANTPTPGWLAQSEIYLYNPGAADLGWKTLAFTGANRIRLEPGKFYIIVLDWRPNDTNTNNALAITTAGTSAATSAGNVYLDGANSTNNGPRITDDAWYRVREVLAETMVTSNVDSGFANQTTPADTDPFNSGDTIRLTTSWPSLGTHFWRVRGMDPAGSNSWGNWTTSRSFDVLSSGALTLNNVRQEQVSQQISLTQIHASIISNSYQQQASGLMTITQAQQVLPAAVAGIQIAATVQVIQQHATSIAGTAHDQISSTIQITTITELTLMNAAQAQGCEIINIGQQHNVMPGNAVHINWADKINLAGTIDETGTIMMRTVKGSILKTINQNGKSQRR